MPLLTTNAILTAYCTCTLCCGPKATGLCADGTTPVQGVTIAAPRNIPLGSTVTIGTNAYRVSDRTAKRFNGRFDIFFASHKDALRFGIRTNKITINIKETVK